MTRHRRYWRQPGPEGLVVTELSLSEVSPEIAQYFLDVLEQRRQSDQLLLAEGDTSQKALTAAITDLTKERKDHGR